MDSSKCNLSTLLVHTPLVIERKRPVHTGSQDIAESISLPYGLGYGMLFGLGLFNLAKSRNSFIAHLYVVLNQAMV